MKVMKAGGGSSANSPPTTGQTTNHDDFREAISRELSIVKGQHTRTVNKLEAIIKAMDALGTSLEEDAKKDAPRQHGVLSKVHSFWRRSP